MPGPANFLDDIANDLGQWIDDTAEKVALAFAPGRAPFSANLSEEQKLEYYRNKLFNPDGSANAVGREAEFQRLGPQGFANVYKALIRRYPNLRVPTPPAIEVPEQWPQAPPPGPPPGPPGPPPGPGGPPPMMPPPMRAMASGGVVTEPTVALIGEAGPEMVVPLPNYQPPTSSDALTNPLGTRFEAQPDPGRPAPGDIQNYIDQAARARNIDPAVAMAVAYHEGGRDLINKPDQPAFTDPAVRGTFPTGSSWWPYQLHYGGPGYEQYGTVAGLGNQFTAQTGYQPGDPSAWRASVDFALDQAVKGGWNQWYGARPAGVSQWQGLPQRRA